MAIPFETIRKYPAIDAGAAAETLRKELEKNTRKIVVLDDDPTGVQTVHDVSVYTGWDEESMEDAFREEKSLFYILTNSRGLTREETTALHHEITAAVDAAARKTGKEYFFISRSDSTLRGHFPLETMLLKEDYEKMTGSKAFSSICPASAAMAIAVSFPTIL